MFHINYYDHVHHTNNKTMQTNHMLFHFLCIVICKPCYSQVVSVIFPGYSAQYTILPERFELRLIFSSKQSSIDYKKDEFNIRNCKCLCRIVLDV